MVPLMRFVVGLIVGAVLGAGGYLGYETYRRHEDPCLELCGTGTTCVEGVCLRDELLADGRKKKRRRGRRRGRRRRRRPAGDDAPPLRTPSASDLRRADRGQSLKGTDYVDMSKGGAEGRELDSAEVEARFRKLGGRIVGCIDRAREGWDISTGRVVVGFRIERSGQVKRVRVTGPTLLLRAGLYDCIRPLVTGLRFPRSSRSLIMSYPFTLQ